jgi:hypothetical protein
MPLLLLQNELGERSANSNDDFFIYRDIKGDIISSTQQVPKDGTKYFVG